VKHGKEEATSAQGQRWKVPAKAEEEVNWLERWALTQGLKRGEFKVRGFIMQQSSSWRTTVLGIIGLATLGMNVAGGILGGTAVDWSVVIPAFTASLAALFARDQKAHEEDVKK
jgi:hypothetical protein